MTTTDARIDVAESATEAWQAAETALATLPRDATDDAATAPGRSVDFDKERQFHDEWGGTIDPDEVPVIETFEACTAPENRYITDWLGDVRGLRVLDLGCGAGEAAAYFALRGADVTAVDLSAGMLEITRRVARRYGVHVQCRQHNAERLHFDDQSFDVVYAANLLHHVNLDTCMAEVGRVLKPDGRFVSWDPLRHNPIINIYRRMAAAVRTEDETPLDIRNVDVFRRHFANVEHRCFWLAGLWIFMRFFLVDRVHPSKDRYWKKIITDADRLRKTYRRLAAADEFLIRHVPWLERMCWNLVVCARFPRSAMKHAVPVPAQTGRAIFNVDIPPDDATAPREIVPSTMPD
jgi:SAM-dependent methyltransferase